MFIGYRIIGIFEDKKYKRRKCKQNEKSGNYQHSTKSVILNNKFEYPTVRVKKK